LDPNQTDIVNVRRRFDIPSHTKLTKPFHILRIVFNDLQMHNSCRSLQHAPVREYQPDINRPAAPIELERRIRVSTSTTATFVAAVIHPGSATFTFTSNSRFLGIQCAG
jgi:hypothetical protein